jgi:uncharacterized RDD family membrane protein YckC
VTGTGPTDGTGGPEVLQPAPLSRRLLAALYDAPAIFTLFLIGTGLSLLASRGARLDATAPALALYRTELVVLWMAYYLTGWKRWGQSLGMRAWKLRVLRSDGTPLRWSDAFLRLAASLIAWLPLALGVFAAVQDHSARAWHDRLSRTRVVVTG